MRFKVGDQVTSSEGCSGVIVELLSGSKTKPRKARIVFDDGTTIEVPTPKIRKNNFKNPNHKSVCGVACMGQGDYKSSIKGEPSRAYSKWYPMIRRCYTNDSGTESYDEVEVCNEWLNFQNFAYWYYSKQDNNRIDYHLDKDLLGNGKLYSPETCCLIPSKLNIGLRYILDQPYYKRSNNHYSVYNHLRGYSTDVLSERHARILSQQYKSENLIETLNKLSTSTTDTRVITACEALLSEMLANSLKINEEE